MNLFNFPQTFAGSTSMSIYRPSWDLTTIPDEPFESEAGRRRRAKGPRVTRQKLEPCIHCGESLNARQRRGKCIKCGLPQRSLSDAEIVAMKGPFMFASGNPNPIKDDGRRFFACDVGTGKDQTVVIGGVRRSDGSIIVDFETSNPEQIRKIQQGTAEVLSFNKPPKP